MKKRDFLKKSFAIGAGGLYANTAMGRTTNFSNGLHEKDIIVNDAGNYILPELPYAYDALEPNIDQETLRIHHNKHHAGYVKGLNNATKQINKAIESDDFSMVKHWEKELAFHGAGHFLHTLYWNSMSAQKSNPEDELNRYIKKSFGSIDNLKKYFAAATASVEGSGWGILAYQLNGDKLVVLQAEKHQNLTQWITIPIMVCDVWEHAYYLKYQNKRGLYIDKFWEIINWKMVAERLNRITKGNSK